MPILCLENNPKEDSNVFFYLWISASVFSSLYSYIWDIKMDWGLFDRNAGENRFLREEIVYSSTVSKMCSGKNYLLNKIRSLKMGDRSNSKSYVCYVVGFSLLVLIILRYVYELVILISFRLVFVSCSTNHHIGILYS